MSYAYHFPSGRPLLTIEYYHSVLQGLLEQARPFLKSDLLPVLNAYPVGEYQSKRIINYNGDTLLRLTDTLLQQLFSYISFLEQVIYFALKDICTNATKSLAVNILVIDDMVNPFLKMLDDLQHIHSKLSKLLFEEPALALWVNKANKITITRNCNTDDKSYQYQEECYTPAELKEMLLKFIALFEFSDKELKESYFFQSQIVKLMAQPVGIHLIKKFVTQFSKELGYQKIHISRGEEYVMRIDGIDGQASLQQYALTIDKSLYGVSATRFKLQLPLERNDFSHMNTFGLRLSLDNYDTEISQYHLSYRPPFLYLAHELRHILNYSKGKGIDMPSEDRSSTFIKMLDISNKFSQHAQWSNPEELRTINFADCCENAVAMDFSYPLVFSHIEFDSIVKAREFILKHETTVRYCANNLKSLPRNSITH